MDGCIIKVFCTVVQLASCLSERLSYQRSLRLLWTLWEIIVGDFPIKKCCIFGNIRVPNTSIMWESAHELRISDRAMQLGDVINTVFSVGSVRSAYKRSEFRIRESFRLCSEVPWWLNKKWQEDFIVIWSASFCVEIRCQETTSEDGKS
jgi:hypothetical protein